MPILSHIFKKKDKKKQEFKRPTGVSGSKFKHSAPKQPVATSKESPTIKQKSLKGVSADKKNVSTVKSEMAHSAYNVVVRPHVSEKSVSKNVEGKYVFEVHDGASKQQIASAIEDLYGVKVKNVNKISVPNKTIMHKRSQGKKRRHNKAVITLEKGQGIEVLPQ